MSGRLQSRQFGWVIFLICTVLSLFWCISAGREIGATADEPIYMRYGLEYWRTGSSYDLMRLGTMPLPVHVTTFPVGMWERWRGEQFDTWTDYDEIMPVARAAALVFWLPLLGYVWRIGSDLGGIWCGRVAVIVIAFEPNLLGHAALATTDIAITAALLAFAYHYARTRDTGWGMRVALPGFLFALALLCKASAVMFVPLCMLAVETERRARLARSLNINLFRVGGLRRFVWESLQIGMIGLAITTLYCGCDWESEQSFVEWAYALPNGSTRDAMIWTAENVRVFNNAGVGIVRQLRHNSGGHPSYILGETSDTALWYYFPVALTMKLSIPILLTIGLALILKPRGWLHWLGLVVLGMFLATLTCRVQIGIRLIFPLLVLLELGAVIALARFYTALPDHRQIARRVFTIGALCLLAAHVGVAWHAWPQGLAYFNQLWGGTENGHLCLSDSNLDWGQGLPELEDWQDDHDADPMDVWYFGTDPQLCFVPMRMYHPGLEPIEPENVEAYFRGRYLAVGKTVIYGSYVKDSRVRAVLDVLRRREPVGETTTFFIYHFPTPSVD